ncbi:hypothetical protein GGI35DRAFT_487762 [Trichoderma velutinum]
MLQQPVNRASQEVGSSSNSDNVFAHANAIANALLTGIGRLFDFGINSETDLTDLVDFALTKEKYQEALFLVTIVRILGHKVNMSRRWHWVRALSVNTGFFEQTHGLPYARTEKQRRMLILQMEILRLAGPLDQAVVAEGTVPGTIIARESWNVRAGRSKSIGVLLLDAKDLVGLARFDKFRSEFRVIEDIPGHLRERRNVSPARYFASSNDAISLSLTAPATSLHHHPVVPNLHCLKDVFHPRECVEMIAAAESVGFLPDIPVLGGGIRDCTRALYFYWVIDDIFYSKLWSRVQALLPKVFAEKRIRRINRWFRLYKYVSGEEFPAHFDGAWPPSGIDPVTDKYIEDVSPEGAKQNTMLTFLIYLNDDFDLGGETTFFLPSANVPAVLNAYPVRAEQGNALLFPHGELDEAVFHEGTKVPSTAEKRIKYVIRTEIVYDA